MSGFSNGRLNFLRLTNLPGVVAAASICLAIACSGCGTPGPTTGQKFRDLFGMSSVNDEINGLSSDDAAVRRWSIQRLAARGRIDLAPDIVLLASRKLEESPDVRAAAAAAMKQMGSRESAPFLARNLDDPNLFVRRQIIDALGSVGSPREAPDLMQMVSSANQPADMRCAAARAVAQIDAENAVPGLIDNLEDSDRGVAAAVHDALVQISRTDMGLKKARWQQWWDSLPKQPAGGATQ